MIAFTYNDANKPKPVNWNPSFKSNDKEPYGLFVFKNELANIFPNKNINSIGSTPYEYFNTVFYTNEHNSDSLFNYVFINPNIEIDPPSLRYLMDFVHSGNNIFISSESISQEIADSLHLELSYEPAPKIKIKDTLSIDPLEVDEPIVKMTFADPNFDAETYTYQKTIDNHFISKYDTLNTKVLGYQIVNKKKKVNFIQTKYGEGNIYFHTQPYIFTNFNLLKTANAAYASNVLSYLPIKETLWDDRAVIWAQTIGNPLRFVLSKPALRWAWQLAILSILLFMIFRAKRRQRIIPIVEKLPNTSINFAKTIGNLYHQEGKPEDIVHKKINFFLEHVRSNYLLDTQNLNDDFKRRLQIKSGVAKIEVERLIDFIVKLSKQKEIGENSLALLDNMIYNFYEQSQNYLKIKT